MSYFFIIFLLFGLTTKSSENQLAIDEYKEKAEATKNDYGTIAHKKTNFKTSAELDAHIEHWSKRETLQEAISRINNFFGIEKDDIHLFTNLISTTKPFYITGIWNKTGKSFIGFGEDHQNLNDAIRLKNIIDDHSPKGIFLEHSPLLKVAHTKSLPEIIEYCEKNKKVGSNNMINNYQGNKKIWDINIYSLLNILEMIEVHPPTAYLTDLEHYFLIKENIPLGYGYLPVPYHPKKHPSYRQYRDNITSLIMYIRDTHCASSVYQELSNPNTKDSILVRMGFFHLVNQLRFYKKHSRVLFLNEYQDDGSIKTIDFAKLASHRETIMDQYFKIHGKFAIIDVENPQQMTDSLQKDLEQLKQQNDLFNILLPIDTENLIKGIKVFHTKTLERLNIINEHLLNIENTINRYKNVKEWTVKEEAEIENTFIKFKKFINVRPSCNNQYRVVKVEDTIPKKSDLLLDDKPYNPWDNNPWYREKFERLKKEFENLKKEKRRG